MIAECIYATGKGLGEPQRGDFYGVETVFDVTVGAKYLVVGMGLFETILLILIRSDSGLPDWLPIGLFRIIDPAVPDHWEFAVLDGRACSGGDTSNRWTAKWGYSQLVRDPEHSDALIQRDGRALKLFTEEAARRSGPASRSEGRA